VNGTRRARTEAKRKRRAELHALRDLGLVTKCSWCGGTGKMMLLRPDAKYPAGWRPTGSALKRKCIECWGTGMEEKK